MFEGTEFTAAIAYARKRKVLLPDEYYGKLVGAQRQQAVSVAGLASVEQIKFVIDAVHAVLAKGGTFDEFQRLVKNNDLGVSLPKHRLDNIFRTNIQAAYARGRWDQQEQVKSSRPYLMYDAINDSRTRPAHAAMDNVVLPRDHPWWATHYPPNGYRCRCSVISLSAKQAERRGIAVRPPDNADPDRGWDYNPGAEYKAGPEKGLKRAVDEVKAKRPAASAKADKAAKAVREKAERAAPTLADVLAAGRQALAELPAWSLIEADRTAFVEALETRLAQDVLGFRSTERMKSAARWNRREAALRHAAEHLKSRITIKNAGKWEGREAGYADALRESIPLPKLWLQRVTARYPSIDIEQSSARAYARQDVATLSVDIEQRSVVLHEFMHLVQVAVPDVQALARELHERRTVGTPQKRLRDIFPGSVYEDFEVTREDQYFMPYVGREYDSRWLGFTENEPLEVVAVAMESLVGSWGGAFRDSDAKLHALLTKDRELAEFALGLLLTYARM